MAAHWRGILPHMDADALYFRLIALLDDPRTYAAGVEGLGALGKLGDPRAIGPLLSFWGDPDVFVPLDQLLPLRGADALLEDLERADDLGHDRWDLRIALVRALGKTGDRRAVPSLLKLLEDGRSVLRRRAAAEALGKIGDPVALPSLLNLSDWNYTHDEVAVALRALLPTVGLDALRSSLDTEQNPVLRAVTIQALGDLGDPAIVPTLLELRATETERTVHRAIAEALGRIGTPICVDTLMEWLPVESDKFVRRYVADGLGAAGDPRAIPLLATMLAQETHSSAFQDHVQKALCRLCTDRDETLIRETLRQAPHCHCWELFVVLESTHTSEESRALIDAAWSDDWRYWKHVVLVRADIPELLDRLATESDSQRIRDIVDRLGEIGDIRAVSPLLELLDSEHVSSRSDAAVALGTIARRLAHPNVA